MGDGENAHRQSIVARFLSLNRTVCVVLVAILCFGMGEQLWEPLMPNFFHDQATAQSGGSAVVGIPLAVLMTVGLYSFLKNILRAFCFLWGGQLTARLGDRRSLMLFGCLALVGYALFLAVPTSWGGLIAALLILSWDPLSIPVTFTTVASSVQSKYRGMAFAVQSIQKRLPKVIGPALAGFLLHRAGAWGETPEAGRVLGMQALVGTAFVFGVTALAIQFRWMPDRPAETSRASLTEVWRTMPLAARRFLVAEIFLRWCDWLFRDFVILYLVVIRGVTLEQAGLLIALQNLVALISYLPIGRLTVLLGTHSFVGLTFVFSALSPLLMAIVPTSWMAVAFVAYGLREIGEPARKAMLTGMLPDATRARGIGLYWGMRTFAVSWAALAGALLWIMGGADFMLYAACACGIIGAALFYYLFGLFGEEDARSSA